MSTRDPIDLASLAGDYNVIGEVSGPANVRTYTATRKHVDGKRHDDQNGVLISVFLAPEGDEGNALSHLAADVKTLSGTPHRRLVPVMEGRWVGDKAFAVVTERIPDESLAQKLDKNETFSNPRIAAILREVNGLLEWARQQHIVHRTVTPYNIFLEPNTDRVRVTFDAAAIHRLQHNDAATSDARTIVRLAMAMLTGSNDPELYGRASLTEARPDLPERLCEATTKLLDESTPHDNDEVASFLALVSMADPLFEGESERDRIRAEVLEEQRIEREKLANERADFERLMEDERAVFAKQIAEKRAELALDVNAARDKLTRERNELRSAAEADRSSLATQRTELERVVAAQRAEIERAAAEDRRQVEKLRAELKHAGEIEIERKRQLALDEVTDDASTLDDSEFTTPEFVAPELEPLKELAFENDNALMSTEPIVAPDVAHPVAAVRRRWLIPAGVAVFVAALAATAIALSVRSGTTAVKPVDSAKPKVAVAQVRAAPVAAPAVVAPSTAPSVDSVGGSVAVQSDSTAPRPKPKPKPKKVVRDTVITDPMALPDPSSAASGVRRDSVRSRRDSVARPDSTKP